MLQRLRFVFCIVFWRVNNLLFDSHRFSAFRFRDWALLWLGDSLDSYSEHSLDNKHLSFASLTNPSLIVSRCSSCVLLRPHRRPARRGLKWDPREPLRTATGRTPRRTRGLRAAGAPRRPSPLRRPPRCSRRSRSEAKWCNSTGARTRSRSRSASSSSSTAIRSTACNTSSRRSDSKIKVRASALDTSKSILLISFWLIIRESEPTHYVRHSRR